MTIKRNVLVTGASGFLGRRIVESLSAQGCSVRALVRRSSKVDSLRLTGVDIVFGDVTDAESLKSAFDGVDYVIHSAADTSGTEEGARLVTIQGTRNILDLCSENQVKKLVYISSCSVYGVADYRAGQLIDENSSLERFPEQRGAYSWGKLEAERLVLSRMLKGEVPAVCLRPGTIYGCGGENYTPLIGTSIGQNVFTVFGNGQFVLPLVYLDNLVDAILDAMNDEKSTGQVYTVVDSQQIDKRRYMDTFIRKLNPHARVFYVPFSLLSIVVFLQEKIFGMLKRKPLMTLYRLMSSQKPVLYDNSKIMKDLGWASKVSFDAAVERIVAHEQRQVMGMTESE
jgi:nucleoside-diphosphate-sugar epimerase